MTLTVLLVITICNKDYGQIEEYTPTEYLTTTTVVTTEEMTTVEEMTTEPATRSLGVFKLTAYCPCVECCGKTNGITATGTQATAGRTIAVDPDIIPYGSKIIINGHTYVAEDCGGAIKNNHIDVYFDSHVEALEFGVRYVEIFITED